MSAVEKFISSTPRKFLDPPLPVEALLGFILRKVVCKKFLKVHVKKLFCILRILKVLTHEFEKKVVLLKVSKGH